MLLSDLYLNSLTVCSLGTAAELLLWGLTSPIEPHLGARHEVRDIPKGKETRGH